MPRDPQQLIDPPPPQGTPLTDPAWPEWFWRLYALLMQGGVSGMKISVGTGQLVGGFSPENLSSDLLTFDKGLFVNYSTSNNAPVSGFKGDILRSTDNPTAMFEAVLRGSNSNSIGLKLGGTQGSDVSGFVTGVDFLGGSMKGFTAAAWVNNKQYLPGQVVNVAGIYYKAIFTNINSAPPSANWSQWSFAGATRNAVGIDFSAFPDETTISSAIRLKAHMRLHFEETGAIGMAYYAGGPAVAIQNEATGMVAFTSNVVTGDIGAGVAPAGLGGGAAATLGNTGAPGPANPAQVGWGPFYYAGFLYYIPLFQ